MKLSRGNQASEPHWKTDLMNPMGNAGKDGGQSTDIGKRLGEPSPQSWQVIRGRDLADGWRLGEEDYQTVGNNCSD